MANQGFGRLVDYFSFESAKLRLVASSDGKGRRVVRTSHYGDFDADHVSDRFLNPVCTYMVVGDMTIDATLGKAWRNVQGGNFMLTNLDIETAVGNFPLLTLSAVANEGADAINMWRVQVPVVARARAQNLLSAVSVPGGSHLLSLRLSAQCEPVVVWQGLAPVASDVVHGKLVVGATVASAGNVSCSAASGWTDVGLSLICGGTDYNTCSTKVEKILQMPRRT